MGISVFPAASAAGKTRFQTTLTSGTSYTVPAGVNYLVVTTVGGGGGSGGMAGGFYGPSSNSGGSGGTTTFTGATSAGGGSGGGGLGGVNSQPGFISNFGCSGTPGAANTGQGARPGSVASNLNNGPDVNYWSYTSGWGADGATVTSIVNTSPGATINYSIGAGGNQGNGTAGNGANGGSGRIEIEYWV